MFISMFNFARTKNHEAIMLKIWRNSPEEKSIPVLEIMLLRPFSSHVKQVIAMLTL